MSLKTKLTASLLSLAVAAVAIAGSAETAAAKKLTNAEAAAIAGIGGFVLGAAIANANRGPDHYGDHRSAWERHVDRCYARYRTYDESSDTFVGFDGQYHYCRL